MDFNLTKRIITSKLIRRANQHGIRNQARKKTLLIPSSQMAAKALFSTTTTLLLLLLVSSVVPLKAEAQTTAEEEKQLLLRIKKEWNYPLAISSWNDSTTISHCSWPGVQCTDDGSVTGISLSNFNLSSPIPPSLCNLRNLTILDLSFNNLPGPFPTSLYNCSSLQYLDLSQNLFVDALPSDLYRMPSNLSYLSLSANNFTGDIPSSIGRLAAIKQLHLDNNLFNGSFPPNLANLSNLEILWLANNPFAPATIPPDFGKLSKLQDLWMAETYLIGEIPQSFENLAELWRLDLSQNSLSGSIPVGIWSLEKLQYIYLYKNSLSGELNPNFGSLDLREIDVSMNKLNGSIPASVGKLQNLTKLLMYWNKFSGEFPASIAMLPNLYDIRLFNNSLTGNLPPELGNHSRLWNIEVDDNRLSGELPEFLCAGGNFSSLVVFNNDFTGNLPASLASCATLQNLQVHNNKFSGEVPVGIWSAVNLNTVIMRGNNLSGPLPQKLPWNLTRIEIDDNHFSGQIPSSAGRLVVFRASNNQISGEIPVDVSGISQLESLTLAGNQITGEIPSVISTLRWLTELDLSNNLLVGQIPASIGTLPVLNTLDLSRNQLAGEIPAALGDLKLNSLNLSSNRLSGHIPISLQNPARDRSFLANPGLCSDEPWLNIRSCGYQSNGSDGFSIARIVITAVGGVAFLVAAVFGCLMIIDRRRRKNGRSRATWRLTSFQSLNFTEANIIRGLTDENLIGKGGSGMVYRVGLGNRAGETVAVKKICSARKLESNLEKEFQSEVEILGSVRHTNIVKLICCISGADSKLLVYEYMANGSLDRWIHDRTARLDWPKRLGIAIGAARGLCYMHHDCSPPIVHRDVKSSNILLDVEFRAKVADFGLARMLAAAGEPETASVVAGSIGCMAPECGYSRKVSEKADVYSFGVVLLELITGREASDGGKHGSLAEWAWRHFQEGNKVVDAIDSRIRSRAYFDEIAVVLKLALVCTGTLPSTRPTMKDVLEVLLRCHQMPTAFRDKGRTESDVAPLLQTKKSSNHKRSSSSGSGVDDDTSSIASNV